MVLGTNPVVGAEGWPAVPGRILAAGSEESRFCTSLPMGGGFSGMDGWMPSIASQWTVNVEEFQLKSRTSNAPRPFRIFNDSTTKKERKQDLWRKSSTTYDNFKEKRSMFKFEKFIEDKFQQHSYRQILYSERKERRMLKLIEFINEKF
jgi:hypothetical protein